MPRLARPRVARGAADAMVRMDLPRTYSTRIRTGELLFGTVRRTAPRLRAVIKISPAERSLRAANKSFSCSTRNACRVLNLYLRTACRLRAARRVMSRRLSRFALLAHCCAVHHANCVLHNQRKSWQHAVCMPHIACLSYCLRFACSRNKDASYCLRSACSKNKDSVEQSAERMLHKH